MNEILKNHTGGEMKEAYLPDALRPAGQNVLVRIGSEFDGGYIIASGQLEKTKRLLSFGLGYDCFFEIDMINNGELSGLHCYDHTVSERSMRSMYVKSILKYFSKTAKRRERISAYRCYRSVFNHPFAEHIELKVSGRNVAGETSLPKALERLAPTGNDIFLKCDIEGSEYEITESVLENAHRFCGMAFEFHDLLERMDEFVAFIERLKTDFVIDHVHVNNNGTVSPEGIPDVVEISLSRKDVQKECNRVAKRVESLRFSQDGRDLDSPCARDRPDVGIIYR